ncbi:hypothetical protein D3C78_1804100 [compost metagenome]
MENLEKYAAQFDAEYPDYSDARHSEISEMITRYDSDTVESVISGDSFKDSVAVILPLIAIKHYKTQVPFSGRCNLSDQGSCLGEKGDY